MKSAFVVSSVLFLLTALPLTVQTQERDKIRIEPPPEQRVDAPFRLFKTTNVWNHLLLDTRFGKVWQVQFAVDDEANRIKVPINERPLALPAAAKPGRFTLYHTDNIWNFLLFDQEDGRVWQIQWSTKGDRLIVPIGTGEANFEPLNPVPAPVKR